MWRRVMPSIMLRLAVAGAAVVLAGCEAAVTSVQPSAVPPSMPRESAQPSQAVSQPSTVFSWPDGEMPTVARAMTGLDEAYINPGAVVVQDGTLHMYPNLFTSWPGPVQTMHLTSTDGVAWTLVQLAPVLDRDDVPLARPGFDVSTGFITPDGTWVLVYETVSVAEPWMIGLATAPGPDGPWTVAEEPALTGGPPGSWDAGGLAWPSVVPTDDGFAMYYSTYATNRRETVIGRATSRDGRTWTKDGAPVLEPEATWEGTGLDRPRVVRVDDRYVMVYSAAELTDRGVAFSMDGVNWERDGDAPVITIEDFPIDGRAWDAALVVHEGVLTYYLEIGTATASIGTDVFRATAELP